MIDLLVVACIAGANIPSNSDLNFNSLPKDCKTYNISLNEEVQTVNQCFLVAPIQIADFMDSHIKLEVHKWYCKTHEENKKDQEI